MKLDPVRFHIAVQPIASTLLHFVKPVVVIEALADDRGDGSA